MKAIVSSILLISSIFFSVSSYGAGDPVLYRAEVQCPKTHSTVAGMLDQLRKIEVGLKAKLKCQEVKPDFSTLIGLLANRDSILKVVSSEKDKELDADRADKVQKYASSITTEVGALVSVITSITKGESSWKALFGQDNKCDFKPGDEMEALSALTSVVYESTQALSKVAGPYGVPLQLGAGVIDGLIKGFSNYTDRTTNVDFSVGFGDEKVKVKGKKLPDGGLSKRRFYENTVCVMTDFDLKFNRRANPGKYLTELKYVREKATEAETRKFEDCMECSYLLLSDEPEDRIEEELEELKEEDFVTRRAASEAYTGRLNLEWLDQEIADFEDMAQSSKGIGVYEVSSLRGGIRDFLYKTAGKDFLKYYITQAKRQNRKFEASTKAITKILEKVIKGNKKIDYKKHKAKILKEIKASNSKAEKEYYKNPGMLGMGIPMPYEAVYTEFYKLSMIIKSSSLVDTTSELYATYVGDAFDDWKNASLAFGVVKEYCQFFRNIKQYAYSVRNVCESNSAYKSGLLTNAYYAFYLSSLLQSHPSSLVKERGPYDFELEDKLEIIEAMKADPTMKVSIPEIDIDFKELIRKENEFRKGSMNGLSEAPSTRGGVPFEDWWKVSVEKLESITPMFIPGRSESDPVE